MIGFEKRFFSKVLAPTSPDGCCLWIGGKTSPGYGSFWNGSRVVLAHRWAYEYFCGPIPDGLQIDHLCRQRACINTSHLEPVTGAENIARSPLRLKGVQVWASLNRQKTHCRYGHSLADAYVDRNGWRKCRICHRLRQSRRSQIFTPEKRAHLNALRRLRRAAQKEAQS